jgi:ubiquinone/menaquinone biosynthesis C-methylase UbiE
MFDLVICNQVLEHLKDFHSILYDIVRVTKPGGYIIIGIPNLAHLINRFYLLFGIQPMCIALQSSHVRGFTHKAFEQILQLTPGITYMACAGSKLIYPLPLPLAIPLSKVCIGICAYTCYLVRKSEL